MISVDCSRGDFVRKTLLVILLLSSVPTSSLLGQNVPAAGRRIQPGTVTAAIEPPGARLRGNGAAQQPAVVAPDVGAEPRPAWKVSKKMFIIIAAAAAGVGIGAYLATRDSYEPGPPLVIPGNPTVGGPR